MYHRNARLQVGRSFTEGVLAAQRRAVLPPLPRTAAAVSVLPPPSPGSGDVKRSASSKKRKNQTAMATSSGDFGFDSMSIHSLGGGEEGMGGRSAPPCSSYKLFSKGIAASDLWQENTVVFVPAWDLLNQFSCSLKESEVEDAMARAARKCGNNQPAEDKVGNFVCDVWTQLVHG